MGCGESTSAVASSVAPAASTAATDSDARPGPVVPLLVPRIQFQVVLVLDPPRLLF